MPYKHAALSNCLVLKAPDLRSRKNEMPDLEGIPRWLPHAKLPMIGIIESLFMSMKESEKKNYSRSISKSKPVTASAAAIGSCSSCDQMGGARGGTSPGTEINKKKTGMKHERAVAACCYVLRSVALINQRMQRSKDRLNRVQSAVQQDRAGVDVQRPTEQRPSCDATRRPSSRRGRFSISQRIRIGAPRESEVQRP